VELQELENAVNKQVINATGVPTWIASSEKSSVRKILKKVFNQLQISKGYYLFAVVIRSQNEITKLNGSLNNDGLKQHSLKYE
jgi:hypothetical protein